MNKHTPRSITEDHAPLGWLAPPVQVAGPDSSLLFDYLLIF